ncbi:hypothetical protein MXD59_17980 [Frankia sp. Ag45/Mut15]|uniref:Uncharacterized protein n=2 Tax=Frankia TaxID=1854 RepID=A0ABT0K1F7_9ACTN|nr:hypothetical protein [Frankia umida]MCK9877640.1 hypothetical protein [Frankia umida]
MTDPNIPDSAAAATPEPRASTPSTPPTPPTPAGPAAPAQPPATSTAAQALTERNEALRLIDSGRATTATVDALRDTGARVNGRPVAEVHLLVDQPGGQPYPVVRAAVAPGTDVDLAALAVASSGRPRRIPVLVDPGRPDNVLLRWDLRPAS